jgi:hypothetical protein
MDPTFLMFDTAYDSDDLRCCAPPYPQQLDFGPDYNFDAEPTLPSWLGNDNAPATSIGPNKGLDIVQMPKRQAEHVGYPWSGIHKQLTISCTQNTGQSSDSASLSSHSPGHRELVPIAPKGAMSSCGEKPRQEHRITARFYTFSIDSANSNGSMVPKRQRRGPYAKKTCLRCQNHGLKVGVMKKCRRIMRSVRS